MPLVRSISGLRATVDDNTLNEELVRDYCRAYEHIISKGDIVIGRDGRPSGEAIMQTAAETLAKCGRNVLIADIVPTPTVQLLVENSSAAGGIIVTASHNPAQWNGLKFLGQDGVFLDGEKNAQLWQILDKRLYPEYKGKGNIREIDNAVELHIESVMKIPGLQMVLPELRDMQLRAVVDAVNASGSEFVPALLKRLGVEVVPLFCDSTGVFPHKPEPLPQNLTQLAASVSENNADIGIAVDPDADRLVLIDENGRAIGEELTVSLAVEAVLGMQGKANGEAVVVNLSTTRVVEDIANKYGAKLYRSPVGEINVVKKMRETGAVIGGEGSGGVIYPECHLGRDSLVGSVLVLSLLAKRRKTLSELVAEFPKYKIVKYKKDFSGNVKELTDKIARFYTDAKINTDDGLRVDFENSWVQVRGSNTEPIVRIIAEAPTDEEAEKLIEEIKQHI